MNLYSNKDFQICRERFLKENKAYWENIPNITDGDKWIYVLHTLPKEIIASTHENVIAKGVQEREKLPIVSVISGAPNETIDRLDASFGFEHKFYSSYHEFDSEADRLRVQALAEELTAQTYHNRDQLLALTYRGIKCGDVIYDDILRRGKSGKRGEVFDCFDISRERYYIFIRNALNVIDKAYRMFEEKKPAYLITTEHVFTKGLYACVASALGAKVLITSIDHADILLQIDPKRYYLEDIKIADLLREMKENALQECRQEALDSDYFFIIDRTDAKKIQRPKKLENGRKNVFILLHALCDAPRQACRHSIYCDYHEWLLETIKIVRTIPNVNWIFKDHPWAVYYGQDKYVKSVFQENKTDNMYWFDRDFDGMEIKNMADCVLTCAGDAGIEYWAYGIPTVTAADSYYCDWGISYHIKSAEEYKNTLKHIAELKKPDTLSVQIAKRYMLAWNNWSKNRDPFVQLFAGLRKKEINAFRTEGAYHEADSAADERYAAIDWEFCDAFSSLLQTNDLKSSAIYRLENWWNMR